VRHFRPADRRSVSGSFRRLPHPWGRAGLRHHRHLAHVPGAPYPHGTAHRAHPALRNPGGSMTRPAATEDRPPGTILVATDLGETTHPTVEAALRLRPPGSLLHLLHVAPFPDPVHLLTGDLSAREGEPSARGMDRAPRLAQVRTHLEGLDVDPDDLRTHLRTGHPHQVIGE